MLFLLSVAFCTECGTKPPTPSPTKELEELYESNPNFKLEQFSDCPTTPPTPKKKTHRLSHIKTPGWPG